MIFRLMSYQIRHPFERCCALAAVEDGGAAVHVVYSHFVSKFICLIREGLTALVTVIVIWLCVFWHLDSLCGRLTGCALLLWRRGCCGLWEDSFLLQLLRHKLV